VRVVIAGGGMIGLAAARLLRQRGIEPVVLERRPAGPPPTHPFMLGYHGYPALEDMGLMDEVRSHGWDVSQGTTSIGVSMSFIDFVEILGRGVPVEHEHTIVDLVRDEGRVVGVIAHGPGGETRIESDLVIASDGFRSRVREMAGIEARYSSRDEGGFAFVSPSVIDRPFAMRFLSYGGVIIGVGWPTGSAGWWTIDKIGADAATAPSIDEFKMAYAALLPEAAGAVEGLTSWDQVHYGEPTVLSCPRWWVPGVVAIGDAAHFFSPETGVSGGLGLGDAHALAEAIVRNPDDPDGACAMFSAWREPIVRPLEAADPSREERRAAAGGRERRPEEHWPPQG
jgi:2-polyprenyl-6-methoxyphenol hydroxylase-like FAD-dependent oxidoreductase